MAAPRDAGQDGLSGDRDGHAGWGTTSKSHGQGTREADGASLSSPPALRGLRGGEPCPRGRGRAVAELHAGTGEPGHAAPPPPRCREHRVPLARLSPAAPAATREEPGAARAQAGASESSRNPRSHHASQLPSGLLGQMWLSPSSAESPPRHPGSSWQHAVGPGTVPRHRTPAQPHPPVAPCRTGQGSGLAKAPGWDRLPGASLRGIGVPCPRCSSRVPWGRAGCRRGCRLGSCVVRLQWAVHSACKHPPTSPACPPRGCPGVGVWQVPRSSAEPGRRPATPPPRCQAPPSGSTLPAAVPARRWGG